MSNTEKVVPPVLPDDVTVEMLLAVPPIAPPVARAAVMKHALLAQIGQPDRGPAAAGDANSMRIVRAEAGSWSPSPAMSP